MNTPTVQNPGVSPIVFSPENEAKAIEWLKTRGGIAVWSNKDLGSPNLGQTAHTPATHADGSPATSPHWTYGNGAPDRIVTNPAEVIVQTYREVAHVKIRRGPPYLGCVHRADRARLDRALESAGPDAAWTADYSTCKYGSPWFDAVITVPDQTRALAFA